MENRITISICDEEYTFVAEEAPSYMQKVGSYVNDKMSELLDAAKVGRTDAAVLTAVNITDELFKEREAGDALRRQVKQRPRAGRRRLLPPYRAVRTPCIWALARSTRAAARGTSLTRNSARRSLIAICGA